MEQNQDIKKDLLLAGQELLKKQIQDIRQQLTDLQESSESEEKSSAGDKYETHQEMLNQSRSMLEKSLEKNKLMLAQLNATPIKKMDKVKEGALVKLHIGTLWISTALGKISLNGVDYQLVSKDSPLVSAMLNLQKGDKYDFRGKQETILEII